MDYIANSLNPSYNFIVTRLLVYVSILYIRFNIQSYININLVIYNRNKMLIISYIFLYLLRAILWKYWNKFIIIISLVPAAWSPWSSWRSCSRSCGGGTRWRVRSCRNRSPFSIRTACRGSRVQTQRCNTNSCRGRSKHDHTMK